MLSVLYDEDEPATPPLIKSLFEQLRKSPLSIGHICEWFGDLCVKFSSSNDNGKLLVPQYTSELIEAKEEELRNHVSLWRNGTVNSA